jgi:RimJ/RimL family protein N-acetyltransferase
MSGQEPDELTKLPVGWKVQYKAAKSPAAKTISGQSVRLERLQTQLHGDALWEATGGLHNAALWQYMSDGPFATRDEFDAGMNLAVNKPDPFFYAILEQQTGLAVGRCAYLNIRPQQGVIEIGHILFSPALQRTRAATEALYLMARHAFEELGYRRYEWKCNALNAKSQLAAVRTGFVFEGVFRQHMIVKGRNRDSAWFSILDSEWPLVRIAFESWLSEENFDKQGAQKHRLSDLMTRQRSSHSPA